MDVKWGSAKTGSTALWLERSSRTYTKMEAYGGKGSFWKMENTDRMLRQALKERVMQLSEVEIEEVIKAI